MERARIFFWKQLTPVMDKLYSRRLRDGRYKNWNEYEAEIKKLFDQEKDFRLLKILQEQLTVLYEVDGHKWFATCREEEGIALFRVDD